MKGNRHLTSVSRVCSKSRPNKIRQTNSDKIRVEGSRVNDGTSSHFSPRKQILYHKAALQMF